ncbi:sulfur carrier protein ThiS [Yinghuangia sp. ASG 101]|uniref:sulfur carrier protein ThiS n=1 Tax=Yinghuangia sp. ASG 101 TaxID=2896848 RepID=UPI001E29A11F|nr:sulfur carrier protein ThiS [Yinghuangia sp. ASG 101]UGQ10012.1 sulfur carrier protein ThiS [Yinghuangia sp. ASG 101]
MTVQPTESVSVNGEPRPLAPGTTLAALVATMTSATKGVAVAVNEHVVPRSAWPVTVLRAGDRVEVLTAVQGG